MPYTPLKLDAVIAALRDGEVVAYPTETFYGLGCNALNPDAVGKIYAVKERPYGLPLPVIIGGREQLERIALNILPVTEKLMSAFWPGPLSIIFTASPDVPDLLTAGLGRIAVRHSPHPGCAKLCRASGMVLTASSANVSGTPPVTRPEELAPEVLKHIKGVYDAQPYPFGGAPSTIVDILSDGKSGAIRVLREGAVSLEDLRNAGFPVTEPAD